MAVGRRTSQGDIAKVFVDLSNYDVDGDMTVIKVRTIKPLSADDLDDVCRAVASKSTVFVDMEGFTGEREKFIESIKAYARGESCQTFRLNTVSILVAPYGVEIRTQRIMRD